MTISEKIRALALEGLSRAEIARRLGIRYQHAYNVLKRSDVASSGSAKATSKAKKSSAAAAPSKPSLSVQDLMAAGFTLSSRWILSKAGDLIPDQPLPKAVGVYAFAKDGIALYVGVATMGIAKRLYFYGKPGITQRTSKRLNGLIRQDLQHAPHIEIYTALPADLEWNGLPVHGSAGLELGLIKKFSLPWNKRSAG